MQRTLASVGSLNRNAPYFQAVRGVGISALEFDAVTGRLKLLSERGGIDNPSFLTVDPGSGRLYAGSEVFGWNEGIISAFSIDAQARTLRYINKQPTLGSIVAHCSLDRTGRHLLAANQNSDTVVVFQIDPATGSASAVREVTVGTPTCLRLARFETATDSDND